MARRLEQDPGWVDAILEWPWTWLLACIGLTGAYILSGLTKFFDFSDAAAEQNHLGLHPGWLWAAIAIIVELIAPILVISGRLVWLGAGALGILTAIATLAANRFGALEGHERFAAVNTFLEHIGLIAGFAIAALVAERSAREKRLPSV